MNEAKRSMFKPALIGGIAEGVAGAIPILNLVNCACGIMVAGGGFLAAWLYLKDAPATARATFGDGLKLGLLTGLIGAVAYGLVSIPLALVAPDLAGPPLEGFEMPPKVAEVMASPVTVAIILGLVSFIFDPIFCAIGAVIGVAVFNKKPAEKESPLDIINTLYARGEIDKEEYEERKRDLS